jgi:hypothetical protein
MALKKCFYDERTVMLVIWLTLITEKAWQNLAKLALQGTAT